jgi:hypothetical protein
MSHASSSMSACSLLPFNMTDMNTFFDSNVESGDERRHLLPTSNRANRVIALPLDASRMLSVQHDAFRLVDPACLVRLPSSEFRVGDNIEFVCFSSPGRGTSSESHFNIAFLVRVASFAHLIGIHVRHCLCVFPLLLRLIRQYRTNHWLLTLCTRHHSHAHSAVLESLRDCVSLRIFHALGKRGLPVTANAPGPRHISSPPHCSAQHAAILLGLLSSTSVSLL